MTCCGLLWLGVFCMLLVLSYPDFHRVMGQDFKVVDLDLMEGLYHMGKLGENVENPFEDLIRMICEVDIPPSPVAAVKTPRRASGVPQEIATYVPASVVLLRVTLNLRGL